MNRLLIVCIGLIFPALAFGDARSIAPEVPAADKILGTLVRTHPRLIVSQADLDRLRTRYATDAAFREWARHVLAAADKVMATPAVKYEIPDGKRLLAVSRRVRDHAEVLAIAYHLSCDRRYVERLWLDLDAARQFKDWNPSHFLDTAEMTFAFGTAYDWLFEQWTNEQRALIRAAIVDLGLKVGLEAYADKEPAWWTRAEHNWNQVCNGGLMLGALAIADEEPELASRIIHEAVVRLPLAIHHYGPDGAWNEGPGYWNYATRYTVRPIAALQTALGTDFGLAVTPGFSNAGVYAMHIVGPSGQAFNYADGHSNWGGAPELWWFAGRFNQPLLKQVQAPYAKSKTTPLELIWGDVTASDRVPPQTPTDVYFRHTEVATMRTAWNDQAALFVGLKAGDNAANHSHLDLGSFVLDAKGRRFIVDLGSDNYNLPGHFQKLRWTYYRLRAEGHNTLVIGPPSHKPDQSPEANAPIVRFSSSQNQAFAITDLTKAYAVASRVARGLRLDKKTMSVTVQDEIELVQSTPVRWFAHTPARISLSEDSRTATLALEGQAIRVRVLEPADAMFSICDAIPLAGSPTPTGQNPNDGIRKLAIELKDVTQTRIVVVFDVANKSSAKPKPLEDWQ